MSSNYVPRVTQLDAQQLDEEVVEIFKAQLLETTKYLSPGLLTPITPELELLLRSIIFKSKMYWLYGYTVVLKYMKDRLFISYTTNKRAQNFLIVLERFQVIGDFFNMIRFLQTGKKPTLIEYLLNLEIISMIKISNQYTDLSWTRELLWHSFIELFGVAAPLLNTQFVRRLIKDRSFNIFSRKKTVFSSFVNSNPIMTKKTKCAECRDNPILPHYMGCEHVFCHFCLQSNKIANPKYRCPLCEYTGTTVMRVPCG
ncbi:peroxisomal biogenesis factor 2 isoform X2 [Arctopsyche grandis]|uniref:peroxisomal biogenesis factor 2 isoform X2 n=1 Tax=Arctopsyche grandis TaxID=121162 RepID=UPI00406D7772